MSPLLLRLRKKVRKKSESAEQRYGSVVEGKSASNNQFWVRFFHTDNTTNTSMVNEWEREGDI